jgi:isopropylmalate/isohomocitrate dehydrogenase-like protein
MENKEYKLCIIKGDGIGPEVIEASLEVIKNLSITFQIEEAVAGYGAYQDYGTPLPEETLEKCKQSDAILFGAVTTPPNIENYFSPIVRLRKELDLYANVRPCRYLPIKGLKEGVDLIVVRENTEGLYIGQEREVDDGAITERLITEKGSERIIRFAFELAREKKRKKVTLVHKANVMRLTDGLFLKIGQKVSRNYSDIEYEEALVDSCAYRLVQNPKNFDVIVTTNMFGDILSDMAAAFGGGLGIAASANIGEKIGLFEPVHGSAPDIEGKGEANPVAAFLSLVMLLEYLGENTIAKKLEKAIFKTLKKGFLSKELGGNKKTDQITEEVICNI